MKVGIIGTGKHGSRYAGHIVKDIAGLELVAISRRSAVGLEQARKWHARYHADWHDLVHDPEVEAVISVTPPTLNLAIARYCAVMRKPLLVEKPLAADSRSGAEMVALFKDADLPLTVGHTLRYNDIIQGLRRNLASAGRLFSFSACHRLEPSSLAWLEDAATAGAGVILHTAVHMFDALRYITGLEIRRVRASRYQIHNPNLEDLFTAQLELADGVVGTVDSSKVGKGRCGRYEFVGLVGELHGDQVHGRLEFIQGGTIMPLGHVPPAPAIVPLLTDWLALLRGDGANPISGEAGLAALSVCDACLRSAQLGGWVEVEIPAMS
ncbi:MAG: Gfo/Idh/MocA family oxidoreductase [Proteobacteria bacterium]|nr:Gfo/Idh/MocA family oxidoreductase [Pseudomonadota bacterium]MBU4294599.1 Gfo/Idh/MocA family oxidoreductase [Pseudomonadota bacterium]MCG2747135.1 Gfo/Idh/MocA family oxidoreductase [Desulfobulbaceae bacterium]